MKQKHFFTFPPDDLMPSLIESYFRVDNAYLNILHLPTFKKSLADGLHLRDELFATIVLLVCALGSRSSNDPRVLLDGFDDPYSAGWKWFRQAQLAYQVIGFEPTSLYDLQIICVSPPSIDIYGDANMIQLLASFLNGSASPQVSWPLVGMGIRLAQSRGAHRKKVYDGGPTVETELLKRAFWYVFDLCRANGVQRADTEQGSCLDGPRSQFWPRQTMRGTGRGVSHLIMYPTESDLRLCSFDVELPLECDDEYWINEDPALAFKQPPGKPAKVAFFNCCIRLHQIHAFALRTIVSCL